MIVNVYDFDKTVYKYDSGVDFVLYSFKKKPIKVMKSIVKSIPILILYLFKKRTLMEFKSVIISYVTEIKDLELLLKNFWDEKEKYINNWYKEIHEESDVFISANYDFLLEEICKRLKVKNLIATHYDFKTKKLVGIHSKGENKIKLFYEKYPNYKMNKTYSDSKVDIPLLEEGKEAYVVKGENLEKYYTGYFNRRKK